MSHNAKIEADEENQEKARVALLQHYSSKSTLQATIILTAALATFAFVQTLPLIENWVEWERTFYEISSLSLLSFVAFRASARLLFWGKLADSILGLKPRCKIYVEGKIKIEKEEPTYFMRFSFAIDPCRESRVLRITNYLTNTRFAVSSLLGICLLWLVIFNVPLVIVSIVGAFFGFSVFCLVYCYITNEKERREEYEAEQKRRKECESETKSLE